jgi:hypothetical protein
VKYIPEGRGLPVLELTRRNLETLLAKLDDPDSARTLLSPQGPGLRLIAVVAVEDDAHYADRAPGATYTNGVLS